MISHRIVYIIWGIFFLFWIIAAIRNNQAVESRESIILRISYLGLLGIAISLIVFDPDIFGSLLFRFVPNNLIIVIIGMLILIFGLGFAVWARLHLGDYWNARITLAKDHQLIRTGPYHIVRNPIYFGGLAGIIGTAIVIGEIRGLFAILFVLIAFIQKIHTEEKLLLNRFGADYSQYMREVKSLIPFIY